MRSLKKPTLTGSDCGPPPTHTSSVSLALGRLRLGVLLCCWGIGITLLIQTAVWGLVTFTELRYENIAAGTDAPLVVAGTDARDTPRSSLDDPPTRSAETPPVNPNRVLTAFDRHLSIVSSITSGLGTFAMLFVIPFIGIGVLLAAGSATDGIDRAVSAFAWALLVGILALPTADLVGLPWQNGVFFSYDAMTAQVDAGAKATGIVFLGTYLLLPLTCVVGAALIGSRFGAGVQAGLMRKEDLAIDGTLEMEAGNVKASSLHGSRTAGAMESLMTTPGNGTAAPAPVPPPGPASLRQIPQGEVPKRLI